MRSASSSFLASCFGRRLAPASFLLALAPSQLEYDNLSAYGRQSGGWLVGDFGQKLRVVEGR